MDKLEPALVLGHKGMLGSQLYLILRELYPQTIGLDIEEIDITDQNQVEKVLSHFRPKVIINCAAYTMVDDCETNQELAFRVNSEGPRNLARATAKLNSKMVHLSTDYIFDGKKRSPYLEEDQPRPLSVYGESKVRGDEGVQETLNDYLIIRTSWLYGVKGPNFVYAILNQAKEGKPLKVVNDQVGSPTYAVDLARTIIKLLELNSQGIVNFSNYGYCSWFEFAKAILRLKGMSQVEVQPISTDQLNLPAKRPPLSVLSLYKIRSILGSYPRPWEVALAEFLSITN